jgi:hypothetical protein
MLNGRNIRFIAINTRGGTERGTIQASLSVYAGQELKKNGEEGRTALETSVAPGLGDRPAAQYPITRHRWRPPLAGWPHLPSASGHHASLLHATPRCRRRHGRKRPELDLYSSLYTRDLWLGFLLGWNLVVPRGGVERGGGGGSGVVVGGAGGSPELAGI